MIKGFSDFVFKKKLWSIMSRNRHFWAQKWKSTEICKLLGKVINSNRLRMFFRQTGDRVLIENNFLRIVIKKNFYATIIYSRVFMFYQRARVQWQAQERRIGSSRQCHTPSIVLIVTQTYYAWLATFPKLFTIHVLRTLHFSLWSKKDCQRVWKRLRSKNYLY